MLTISVFRVVIKLLLITSAVTVAQRTFTSPILDHNSADPSAFRLGYFYYLTISMNTETELTIFQSSRLSDFRNATQHVVYMATEGFSDVWASEMHLVNGQLYIYFCMHKVGEYNKMYAIKAEEPTNPMGKWSDPIRLMPDWDEAPMHDAIDGTIFNHGNGKMYFVWATSYYTGSLSLYIAEMEDAVTVSSPKVLLRSPSSTWEGGVTGVNEEPYFIYNRNVSFLIFSAEGTGTPNYCLGMMSIDGDKDPMNTDNWWYGDDQPVFWRNDEENVYTTGHAAFTTSPDGTETWMVYHAVNDTSFIWGNRIARIEKITWDAEDGKPVFPRPHGFDNPQPVPSGELN